jgi:hypothetical protein
MARSEAVCIGRSEASSVLPGDHSANAADTAGSIALGSPSRTPDRLSAASGKRGRFVQGVSSGYSPSTSCARDAPRTPPSVTRSSTLAPARTR